MLIGWEATDWLVKSPLFHGKIRYWHPRSPNTISEFDLSGWETYKVVPRPDHILFAQKGNECLFWHLGLGVGVRSEVKLPDQNGVSLWYSNGAFFFATTFDFSLHIVPLHPDTYAALAHDRTYSAPEEAPFVRARLVSTGVAARLCTLHRDALTPAVFVIGINQLYLLAEKAIDERQA